MSIVALKNKTAAKYNSMSVGHRQFSLNGGYRNQGWVGQTMLSRSLPKTCMRGNTPIGSGGCCGKYMNNGIVQSAVTSLNDSSVIKGSSINNLSMIHNDNRYPYRWVRKYSRTDIVDSRLNKLKQKTLACKENSIKNKNAGIPSEGCKNLMNNEKPVICSVVTKDAIKTVEQSTYIEKLTAKCDIKKEYVRNACKMSSGGGACGF
jgi:hypothetical protein